MNKLFKKADLILIVCLLAVCSVFFLLKHNSTDDLTAVVYVNGTQVSRVDLSNIEPGYESPLNCTPAVTVKFEKNSVCFSNAQCKDKLCVLAGKLTHKGDVAACLPCGAVIVIEGSDSAAPDAITY